MPHLPPQPPPTTRRPTVTTLRRLTISAESGLPLLARRSPRTVGRRIDSESPAKGREVVVVAANLARGEHDVDAQARTLVALDADVLLLCEHTAATRDALDAAGLARRWPHRSDDHHEGFFGTMVASRLPIVAARCLDLGDRPAQVVDLRLDRPEDDGAVGTVLRVVPVHTQAPIFDRDVAVWRATIDANAAVADDAPGPVVLGGDWNATGGHRTFRRALARHGLVDASAALGHRWFPTWPVDRPVLRLPLPPVLTLDHVVVSRDVEVVAVERIPLPGTDHRALRATLRLVA